MKQTGIFVLLATLFSGQVIAQVTPDGGTATAVATGANGVINVSVATPNSDGISHNTYTNFNVPQAGKDVDADRDGVFDSVDPVNAEAVIGKKLVPLDTDGDGVVDYLDSDAVAPAAVVAPPVVAPPGPRKTASMNYMLILMLALFMVVRTKRRD